MSVARIDFVDPALAGRPGVRERGLRVEVRPLRVELSGSGYASPAIALDPAILRIDLLESRAGAADRMHWHPVMEAGEPGDRVMEPALGEDPVGWLRTRLLDFDGLSEVEEICTAVADGLATVRAGSWDGVVHDEHGLAELG